MLAPCKEPPCQVQGYRIPLAGVNRRRNQQTPVNQDCHAGRRKEIAQPRTNGCGGWETSEGSKGEQSDFPTGKNLLTAPGLFMQRDSMAQWALQGGCTAQRAMAWCPSQLHGTAQHSGQQQCQAACTSPAWHTLHRTDLPAPTARHSWGQPEPPACSWAGSATALANSRGAGHPSAEQGGRQRGHGRGEEQLNGPRPHGACSNRHHHTLPKHLLPPRWHGASARGGHGAAAAAGSTPGPAARSGMSALGSTTESR